MNRNSKIEATAGLTCMSRWKILAAKMALLAGSCDHKALTSSASRGRSCGSLSIAPPACAECVECVVDVAVDMSRLLSPVPARSDATPAKPVKPGKLEPVPLPVPNESNVKVKGNGEGEGERGGKGDEGGPEGDKGAVDEGAGND